MFATGERNGSLAVYEKKVTLPVTVKVSIYEVQKSVIPCVTAWLGSSFRYQQLSLASTCTDVVHVSL